MNLQLLNNEPALLLIEPPRRILVVADLHLGYERIFFKDQNHVPNLSKTLVQHLNFLVSEVQPTEIIILGDIKHSVKGFSRLELHEVSKLLQTLQDNASITIIRGNHDANIEMLLPEGASIAPTSGLLLRFDDHRVFLLHGHAKPGKGLLKCNTLILAHIHPVVAIPRLRGRYTTHRVWVRTRLKPTIIEVLDKGSRIYSSRKEVEDSHQIRNIQVLIMPAFHSLLQGHILNRETKERRHIAPIFRHLALEDAELFMIDHSPIGKLFQLQFKKD
ncbi:MAG: metallophosphoesterase [Promethearchaeota archaeon]